MGCSRQEDWSGLLCPPAGDLPDPRVEPARFMSPALAGELLTTSAAWEAHSSWWVINKTEINGLTTLWASLLTYPKHSLGGTWPTTHEKKGLWGYQWPGLAAAKYFNTVGMCLAHTNDSSLVIWIHSLNWEHTKFLMYLMKKNSQCSTLHQTDGGIQEFSVQCPVAS